jgi:heat shock protein HslJ
MIRMIEGTVADLARVTGGTYDGVTLRQVESASGAKYEGESGLTLWTKNDEVRLETAQRLAYQGAAIIPPTEELAPSVPAPVESATTSTTSSVLPEGVVDVVWQWQEATQADGEIITPNKPEAFTVRFTSAGAVEGATDCNGFGGGYTVGEDGQLVLGEFMSTLMYCDGSQEQVFTGLLVDGITITAVTDATLTLNTTAGGTVTFVRQVE